LSTDQENNLQGEGTSVNRYGAEQTGAGGKSLPFACPVKANGWLRFRSGCNGQWRDHRRRHHPADHKTIADLDSILAEAVVNPSTSSVLASGWAIGDLTKGAL
jgi:hypothetical protein